MDWHLLGLLAPYVIGLVIPLGVSIYVFRHNHINGARQYGWYVASRSVWNAGLLLELISLGLRAKTFWLIVEALTIPVTLVCLELFFLAYTETRLRKLNLVWWMLVGPPALFVLIVITNSWHGLVMRNTAVDPASPFSLVQGEFTLLAWITLAYSALMMLVFFGILIGKFVHAQPIYRSQVITIMLGMITDLLGVGLAITLNQRGLIPPAAAAGNLIVTWGLFRFRLFDLRPIARDNLFETTTDLVMVLDAQNRIVDINRNALSELHMTSAQTIGRLAYPLFTRWPDLVEEFREPADKSLDFAFEREGEYYHYDIKSTLLRDGLGNYQGRVFVARDVTDAARMHWQVRTLNDELSALNAELEARVRLRTHELADAYDTTLEGWALALELRDKEIEGHSRRVTDLTLKLARALQVAEAELDDIRRGALLHDIGKMAIPDEILRKTDDLTRAEREIIAQHPLIAYRLLSPIRFLEKALEIPYCHHEKWDGSGYPRGIKGEAIPFSARIFSVADVWDAIRSDRTYRKAWSMPQAQAYMREQTARYFDPHIVDVFLDLVEQDDS